MKWSTLALGIIIICTLGVAALLLFQNLTTTNENDYYLLKESTHAAMLEAVDMNYYKETGEIKIDKNTFIEMFLRRYAESNTTKGEKTNIIFYDIMEEPPKATVVINTNIKDKVYTETVDADVENYLSAILEVTAYGKAQGTLEKEYSYITKTNNSEQLTLNIPDELKSINSNGYIDANSIRITRINILNTNLSKEQILKEIAAQKLYYSSGNIVSINEGLDIGAISQNKNADITKGCNHENNKYCITIPAMAKNKIIGYKVTWSYDYAASA